MNVLCLWVFSLALHGLIICGGLWVVLRFGCVLLVGVGGV